MMRIQGVAPGVPTKRAAPFVKGAEKKKSTIKKTIVKNGRVTKRTVQLSAKKAAKKEKSPKKTVDASSLSAGGMDV